MAEVVAPSQDRAHDHDTTPRPATPLPRRPAGRKRAADTSLDSEQRLSKRFDLLNLENGTRLYLPVPGSTSSAITPSSTKHAPKPIPIPSSPPKTKNHPQQQQQQQHTHDETTNPTPMVLDDTPHRIYIPSLTAELASLSPSTSEDEDEEEHPIFLPDIERHLSRIPAHVLASPRVELTPTRDNQLVLYSVPRSLTVPEAQDGVRKAIVEARARVRERESEREGEAGMASASAREIPPTQAFDDDVDAMDID